MKVKDFADYGIKNVSPEDITGTGAPLDSVNVFLILRADEFIGRAGLPVVWLPNGLTTGAHRATWHPRGLAWDLAFNCDQKLVKMYELWKLAIECEFKGIGVYWNGIAYSMHLDLRPALSLWGGVKEPGKEWDYFSVFRDPAHPLTF
jgi:hypothetical protein